MTGTSIADSSAQEAAADSRALYKQKDYLRSLKGVSDDELHVHS